MNDATNTDNLFRAIDFGAHAEMRARIIDRACCRTLAGIEKARAELASMAVGGAPATELVAKAETIRAWELALDRQRERQASWQRAAEIARAK
jgi:hypothetical protein